MTPIAFTALFLAALGASLAVRIWLSRRQVSHVQAHREIRTGALCENEQRIRESNAQS